VLTAEKTHNAATETTDRTAVESALKNQNLCLDKSHDFPEIQWESIKIRLIPHIPHRDVEKELIEIGYARSIEGTNSGHDRLTKLHTVRKEITKLSYVGLISLLYRRL
jgi:hypothetical protein